VQAMEVVRQSFLTTVSPLLQSAGRPHEAENAFQQQVRTTCCTGLAPRPAQQQDVQVHQADHSCHAIHGTYIYMYVNRSTAAVCAV
jgi:hypothetical protein